VLSEKQVFSLYQDKAIVRHHEFFLPASNALDFLETCDQNCFAVVGMEGFIYDGQTVQPQLDLIADYSAASGDTWEEFKKICNASARAFLGQLPTRNNLVFTFVLMSREEREAGV
jgi:hypothetical protein